MWFEMSYNNDNNHTRWIKKINVLYSVVIATLILSSTMTAPGIARGIESFIPMTQTNNDDGKVFDTISSKVSSNTTDGNMVLNSSSAVHDIVIKEQVLPDGEPAYKMIQHIINQTNGTKLNITNNYSTIATIPGPAIVISEGDKALITINHLGGNTTQEDFVASNPGTYVYQDEELGDRGLYGVVIVNPKDRMTEALVDGKITTIPLDELDKEVLLFMVGSTFWGMEVDRNGTQTPLWTNPVPVAEENQKIRFHIVGIGPSSNPNGHSHTFHLHAHRWVDPGTSNIIDVKEIHPG